MAGQNGQAPDGDTAVHGATPAPPARPTSACEREEAEMASQLASQSGWAHGWPCAEQRLKPQ
eukprot:6480577-Pyramimonas_sp.AAC.1